LEFLNFHGTLLEFIELLWSSLIFSWSSQNFSGVLGFHLEFLNFHETLLEIIKLPWSSYNFAGVLEFSLECIELP